MTDILKMLQNNSEQPLAGNLTEQEEKQETGIDDRTPEEIKKAEDTPIEDDLYSIKNFSI